MRIALDAMGGDRAPAAPVDGAVEAVRAFADLDVVLVGDPAAIGRELDRVKADAPLVKAASGERSSNLERQQLESLPVASHNFLDFITTQPGIGTAAEISPIVSVDKYPVGSGEIGPVTRELERVFDDVLRGGEGRYAHWRTPVRSAVAV